MKIEKGVPIPDGRGRKPRGTYSDVIGKLEVGDSFTVTGENAATMQSALRQAAKRAGIKITVRNMTEQGDELATLRVWRVEGEPCAVAQGMSPGYNPSRSSVT